MDKQTDRMKSLLDEDIGAIVLEGKRRRRRRKCLSIVFGCLIIFIIILMVGWSVQPKVNNYLGIENMNSGLYEEAAICFKRAGNYSSMGFAYRINAHVSSDFYLKELPATIGDLADSDAVLKNSSYSYDYYGNIDSKGDWQGTLQVFFQLMENSEYNDISDSADYVGDNLCLYVLEPGVYDWINIAIYTSDGVEICNRTYSVENTGYYIEDGKLHYYVE